MNVVGTNVGIGTTSPVAISTGAPGLTLNGTNTSVGAGLIFQVNGTTKSYQYVEANILRHQAVAGVSQSFWTNGSEKMRIDTSGNVGIGTTSPGIKLEVVDSTDAQLEVSGYSLETSTANAANGTILMGNNSSYRGVIDYNASSTGDLIISNTYNNATSGIRFKVSTSDAGGITAMKIKGNGNVGIGTISPGSKLQVAGEIRAADGTKGAPSYTFTSDTNTGMYSDIADQLKFAVGGDQKLRVTSTGITVTGIVTTTDLAVSGVASVDGGFTSNGGNTMNVLTITGNLTCQGNITVQDSDKILIGNSGDLELYHRGS
jgi:hypothetical protein